MQLKNKTVKERNTNHKFISHIYSKQMYYGKNLTGEKKATFSTLDTTQSLNIDDDGSFLSSGNILSTGKKKTVHGDYDDLFVMC